jgi:hypothetical protein
MSKTKKKQMTVLGVGLKFAIISIFFAAIIFAIHFLWMPHLNIPISRMAAQVLGILLVIIGVPIYLGFAEKVKKV